MPVSHKHKLIMVHIPKNAGTAIEKSLSMEGTGHFNWKKYARELPTEWDTYKSFSVLRNPIDRFISSYNYAKMKKSYWHSVDPSHQTVYGKHIDYDMCIKYDLNDIVEPWLDGQITLSHPSWMTQYEWIVDGDSVAVDYLALFERLDEAMEYLAPGAEIKKINKSKTDNPVELSSKNIELLNTHYSVDLNLYEQMDGRALCRTDGEDI